MSVDQLLDDVQEELAALWGAGLALPGPDRAVALCALAERFGAIGLHAPATRLTGLAGHLGAAGDEVAAYRTMQELAAWVRTFRHAWSLQRARERLDAGPEGTAAAERRSPGFSGTVSPVGLERAGTRLTIQAIDDGGRRVTLSDEVSELDERDPLRVPAPSRLFQDRVRYLDVLRGDLELEDHPKTAGRGPTVFGPAFYTRPRAVRSARVTRDRLPGGRVTKRQLSRLPLTVRSSGDEWRFEHDGGDVTVSMSDVLTFNLAKWTGLGRLELDAVVLGRGGGAVLLECLDALGDRCFPAVDPMAIRWPWRRVQAAAGGWPLGEALLGEGDLEHAPEPWRTVIRWWRGAEVEPRLGVIDGPSAGHLAVWAHVASGVPIPESLGSRYLRSPLPERPGMEEIAARGLCLGGASGRALVEAHVAQLRRGVAQSSVVPDGWSVWALADARARLGGADPRSAPVAGLGLPWGTLWNNAVEPLVDWVRGEAADLDEVASALWLIQTSQEEERFWVR